MTDHNSPDTDELASALLDGEDVAPDAITPAVENRRAEFGAVADAVRDVPPPPSGLLESHIDAALAVFDERDGGGSSSTDAESDDPSTVVPLSSRPTGVAETRPFWQRIPLGAVAAAAVVVALVAVGVLTRTDPDQTDTAATTLEDRADDGGVGAASEALASEAGGEFGAADDAVALDMAESDADASGAGPAAAPAAPPAHDTQRSFESVEQLRSQLREEAARVQEAPGDTGPGAGGDAPPPDPCGIVDRTGTDPANVVLLVAAAVDGEAVTALVHETADGLQLAVLVDETCEFLVDDVL